MLKFTENSCIKCNHPLDDKVYTYSKTKIGFGLCRRCQNWFNKENNNPTREAKLLYLALKERNIPVEIEKYDGFKTIDLAIPSMKFNIEVDGLHHNTDLKQATSDLLRTLYSLKKGFLTLRIPNILINESLNETADSITTMMLTQKKELANESLDSQTSEMFKEMVLNFMVSFYTVFESDWGYSCDYIVTEGPNCGSLLSECNYNGNWQNKDFLLKTYYDLHDFINKNGLFKKLFENEKDWTMYEVMFRERYKI